MNEKQKKLIFRVSLGLNILLLVLMAWGYQRLNFVKDQVYLTEVQYKLVKLEGVIANQMNDHWAQPSLVTTELDDILNGIWLGLIKADQLGTLSSDDKTTIYTFYNKLNQFPRNEIDLTEQDKQNFEKLRKVLRDAGVGLDIQVHVKRESMIDQMKKLEKSIQNPLQ